MKEIIDNVLMDMTPERIKDFEKSQEGIIPPGPDPVADLQKAVIDLAGRV